MRRSLLLTALAVCLVALHGLVHGWMTDRWSESGELSAFAERLPRLPKTVGDWVGEDLPMSPRHQVMAGIRGYVLRQYTHRRTKTVLSLLVVCGRGGPISVHTPDVCYRGAGYRLSMAAQRRQFDSSDGESAAEFWVGSFRNEEGAQLQVSWAWNDQRGWKAPDYPRFTYGGVRVLFKLYVVRDAPAVPSATLKGAEADPVADFLRVLLPALDATLSQQT